MAEIGAPQPDAIGEPVGTGPGGGIVWRYPDGSHQELHIDAHTPDMLSMAAHAHIQTGLPFMNPSLLTHGEPSGVPHFAEGGIVDEPTPALVGEAGPEAIVPLDQDQPPQGTPPGGSVGPGPAGIAGMLGQMTQGTASQDALDAAKNTGEPVTQWPPPPPDRVPGGVSRGSIPGQLSSMTEATSPEPNTRGTFVDTGKTLEKPAKPKAGQQNLTDDILKQELGANTEETAARVAKSQNIANQLEQNIGEQQLEHDRQVQAQAVKQKAMLDAERKYSDLGNQVANMREDPTHFMKDTKHQILGGLAIAIGGLGQAFSRRGGNQNAVNVGAEMVDKAIQRDIDAQRQNYEHAKGGLEAQKTIYGMAMDRYQDQRLADLATNAWMKDHAANQIESITAASESPIIQAQGKQQAQNYRMAAQKEKAQLGAMSQESALRGLQIKNLGLDLKAKEAMYKAGGPVNPAAEYFGAAGQIARDAAAAGESLGGAGKILPANREAFHQKINNLGAMIVQGYKASGGRVPEEINEQLKELHKNANLEVIDTGTLNAQLAGVLQQLQAQETMARRVKPTPHGAGSEEST